MSEESLLDKAFAAPEPPTNLGEGNRLVPGELLSRLRHDMRTPIHQILGYAEMLEEDARAEHVCTVRGGDAGALARGQGAEAAFLFLVLDQLA